MQKSPHEIPLFHKEYLGGYELVKGYSKIPGENGKHEVNIEVDNYLVQSVSIQGTLIPRALRFSLFDKEIEVGSDCRLFFDYGIGARKEQKFDINNGIYGYGIGSTFFIDGSELNIDLAYNQSGDYRIHFYGSVYND